MNIRFSGFGGQGVVLSGVIYGEAAVLDGMNAVQTQSYGSESRGGACKSDVIISEKEIYELEASQLDVLVAMSQAAYERYIGHLKKDGVLVVDSDLVRVNRDDLQTHGISATDIAFKKFGRKIMANMVLLGYLAALIKIISPEALKFSIHKNVPGKTIESNIEAFEEGYHIGLKEMGNASAARKK